MLGLVAVRTVSVFASPLADFTREMQQHGVTDQIIELDRGASVTV